MADAALAMSASDGSGHEPNSVELSVPVDANQLEPVTRIIFIEQPPESPTTPQPPLVSPPSTATGSVAALCKCQHCPVHSANTVNGTTTSIQSSSVITPASPATTTAVTKSLAPHQHVVHYVRKFRGQRQPLHKYLPWRDMGWAFIGSFLGIAFPALLTYECISRYADSDTNLTMIIGSFGASAVLLYSSIVSDFAQPRSVIGGHVVSAFIGVCVRKMFPYSVEHVEWLLCALAVSLAIFGMNVTRTLHPPGGATALIAVLPSPTIQSLGFLYVVIPVGAGIVCMVLVALLVNNLPRQRHWPKWWY